MLPPAQVKLLHPPGTEIYRNGNISMFEVRRLPLAAWRAGGLCRWPCSGVPSDCASSRACHCCACLVPFCTHWARPAIPPRQVDGRKAKTYCQNLCYLAKLFLVRRGLGWAGWCPCAPGAAALRAW